MHRTSAIAWVPSSMLSSAGADSEASPSSADPLGFNHQPPTSTGANIFGESSVDPTPAASSKMKKDSEKKPLGDNASDDPQVASENHKELAAQGAPSATGTSLLDDVASEWQSVAETIANGWGKMEDGGGDGGKGEGGDTVPKLQGEGHRATPQGLAPVDDPSEDSSPLSHAMGNPTPYSTHLPRSVSDNNFSRFSRLGARRTQHEASALSHLEAPTPDAQPTNDTAKLPGGLTSSPPNQTTPLSFHTQVSALAAGGGGGGGGNILLPLAAKALASRSRSEALYRTSDGLHHRAPPLSVDASNSALDRSSDGPTRLRPPQRSTLPGGDDLPSSRTRAQQLMAQFQLLQEQRQRRQPQGPQGYDRGGGQPSGSSYANILAQVMGGR